METILSISGKPGLYRLVSRGKMNLIVETLDEAKKRMPAFATDRITSLAIKYCSLPLSPLLLPSCFSKLCTPSNNR